MKVKVSTENLGKNASSGNVFEVELGGGNSVRGCWEPALG
jgi:hypothetical protein